MSVFVFCPHVPPRASVYNYFTPFISSLPNTHAHTHAFFFQYCGVVTPGSQVGTYDFKIYRDSKSCSCTSSPLLTINSDTSNTCKSGSLTVEGTPYYYYSQFSIPFSYSVPSTYACDAGFHNPTSGSTLSSCVICGINTYSSFGSASCTSCPCGTTNSNQGSTSSESCVETLSANVCVHTSTLLSTCSSGSDYCSSITAKTTASVCQQFAAFTNNGNVRAKPGPLFPHPLLAFCFYNRVSLTRNTFHFTLITRHFLVLWHVIQRLFRVLPLGSLQHPH